MLRSSRALPFATCLQRCRRFASRAPQSRSYDAVIIGAGVIGNALATELSRSGRRTLNIDKLPGSGHGSTGYSSGVLRMMYSLPDSVKFAWEGYTYFERWAEHIGVQDEAGLAEMRRCGALILRNASSQTYLNKVVAAYDAVGLEYEEWDAMRIEQALKFDLTAYGPPRRIDDDRFGEPNGQRIEGGVHFPLAGYVSDPQLAARNLQTAAEATGQADFAFASEVTAVLRDGGRVKGVRLADGTQVHAPVVVNVAGPHSKHINSLAFPDPTENDMRVTTRPMRQEVAYVQPPPEVDWNDGGEGMICSDLDAGVYFRPEVGGKILLGSVEPECDASSHVYPEDPESVYPGRDDSSLTDQWTNQVYRLALRMPTMPLPDSANTQGCVACYDVTEDWVPIYDKSALPGYYMAVGTSGNQFKCAGPAGRLMREIIEATEAGQDVDSNPLQFQLKRIPGGGTISSATFSRRRSVLETSNSVLG
eukprot:TRINITY_DN23145_c0_g1_i1.p1 TRINITY_DN23145_c0_g1~~TRINITY_DN23145_c0_g1_i1.p1  ORF type:complete len:485 (-),score=53.66 TRINITY_DN23145_c0_g1_i1:187-1617(-)